MRFILKLLLLSERSRVKEGFADDPQPEAIVMHIIYPSGDRGSRTLSGRGAVEEQDPLQAPTFANRALPMLIAMGRQCRLSPASGSANLVARNDLLAYWPQRQPGELQMGPRKRQPDDGERQTNGRYQ